MHVFVSHVDKIKVLFKAHVTHNIFALNIAIKNFFWAIDSGKVLMNHKSRYLMFH